MAKNVKTRIQHKHDTEVNWRKATDFTPLPGELIFYDQDEWHTGKRVKVGDGSTPVGQLPFAVESVLLDSTETTAGLQIYNDGIKHIYSLVDASGSAITMSIRSSGNIAAPLTENVYYFESVPTEGLSISIGLDTVEPTIDLTTGEKTSQSISTFIPCLAYTDCLKPGWTTTHTIGSDELNFLHQSSIATGSTFRYVIYPPKDITLTNAYSAKAKVTIEVKDKQLFIKNELFFSPTKN